MNVISQDRFIEYGSYTLQILNLKQIDGILIFIFSLLKRFRLKIFRVGPHLLGRPVGETEQYTALSTRSIVLFSIVSPRR